MADKPKYVSLFCGCGGMDLGFTEAGFRCVAAYDIDKNAIKVHRKNFGDLGVILDLSTNFLPENCHYDIDLLIAGPPCQGFSTAGKRLIDDRRNFLLYTPFHLAKALNPKVVVVENVNGVASGKHKEFWDTLNSMFYNNGYYTTELVFNADEYSVPQLRKRRLIIAWKKEYEINGIGIEPIGKVSLRTALEGVENSKDHAPVFLNKSSKYYKIAERIGQGEKLCNVRGGPNAVHTWDIPEVFGKTTTRERKILETIMVVRRRERRRAFGDADPVLISRISSILGYATRSYFESLRQKNYLRKVGKYYYDLSHTFNGKFRRLDWEKPSYAVDTRFGDPRYFLHPEEHRGFSTREAARIQGFPDNFIFPCTKQKQYELIGNAVPPPLSRIVGEHLRDIFFRG
ncbi:DNA (cytosine-5)-methyltransferase 1 [Desulfosalsimonas propionicica]|uniref:Cytosine-specific methyltransferase n=1 Tax=Desulfosalsimonas propionicica TaxID=332175 RepID=A0A7W0HL94_9BACT|nr:DNA cytosine methyltransferase [Desulfosalsimonas propionicica]MBA2882079.1 DNA (cytosine-5)-methyltransferase 1 [Desulfosalsimonas propionicica]